MSVAKTTISGGFALFETLTASVPAISTSAANNRILQEGFDDAVVLTSSTTPTVTDDAFFEVTLSGGAATIDLTSITGTNGRSITFSGSKVRAIKFRNKVGTNSFTVAKGASNGFTGLGASFSALIPAAAGAWVMYYDAGAGTAVSGSVKTLDVTGTGSQVLQVAVVVGA